MAIKTAGKLAIGVAILGAGYFGLSKAGLLNLHFKKSAQVEAETTLPTIPANALTAGLTYSGAPSDNVTSKALPKINLDIMAWNAQMGVIFANGGAQTTEGSLMEKHGVFLTIKRQDDINQASTELIKFAKDYKDNPASATGTNMFGMMGDGSPATLASLNEQLKSLGDDYKAVVIGALGRSNGEDAVMAPAAWKENPQNAIGGTIVTVIRDGDWNIAIKWAKDNNIPVNPDEKTYDPTALNFINAADFTKSAEMYVNGYKESRKVVKNGVATGQSKEVTIDAVSTWTPADVTVATGKGGLVRLISTHEYSSQMAGVLITIKKYAADNRANIVNFLLAATEGGDQVKSYASALDKGGELSAKVYNEKDGAYWVKYSKGTIQPDKTGTPVDLGGSSQFNLGDNLLYFGIAPGSSNIYTVVYNTFSAIDKQYYPEMFKSFPKADEVFDPSYLVDAQKQAEANGHKITQAATQTYSAGAGSQIVASKAYSIEFAIGSAELTPGGKATVREIANSLLVAQGLKASLDGYTDASGSAGVNANLSKLRAEAVKAEIQSLVPSSFPESRFTVAGHGSDYSVLVANHQPVGDNNTAAGAQSNRRVQVTMTK